MGVVRRPEETGGGEFPYVVVSLRVDLLLSDYLTVCDTVRFLPSVEFDPNSTTEGPPVDECPVGYGCLRRC